MRHASCIKASGLRPSGKRVDYSRRGRVVSTISFFCIRSEPSRVFSSSLDLIKSVYTLCTLEFTATQLTFHPSRYSAPVQTCPNMYADQWSQLFICYLPLSHTAAYPSHCSASPSPSAFVPSTYYGIDAHRYVCVMNLPIKSFL